MVDSPDISQSWIQRSDRWHERNEQPLKVAGVMSGVGVFIATFSAVFATPWLRWGSLGIGVALVPAAALILFGPVRKDALKEKELDSDDLTSHQDQDEVLVMEELSETGHESPLSFVERYDEDGQRDIRNKKYEVVGTKVDGETVTVLITHSELGIPYSE